MESREETTAAPGAQQNLPEWADKALNNLERLFKEQFKTTSRGGRWNLAGKLLLSFSRVEFPGFWILVECPWQWTLMFPLHFPGTQSDGFEYTGWRTSGSPEAERDLQSAGGGWRFMKIVGWSSFCGPLLALGVIYFKFYTAGLLWAYYRSIHKQTHAKLCPGDTWWVYVTLGLCFRGKRGATAKNSV